MLIPLSWLREYVEIDVPVEVLAERLTTAGMEVAKLHYLGIPQQEVAGIRFPKSDHLVWDRDKLVLGKILAVNPHPNADKLVIATVEYGASEPEQVVTGAPNLYQYRESGALDSALWTGLALEGAEVWDGHSDTPRRMILKGKELRGVYNKSMVCSELELGLSAEHEGIILFHSAPVDANGTAYAPGTPLQDVLGDVILEIELTPNLARCFSVIGVAREIAALFDKPLRYPSYDVLAEGAPIAGEVSIVIENSEYNPRFTLALLRGTTIQPSPEWMQRRLRAVGQRPINNIVDVTNYITFEIGQPLHAFDYDKLRARAGGNPPTIITRLPKAGETLQTLDGVARDLQAHNILVTDSAGVLSLGGVIGGADTEIDDSTTNVLLEAAAWNFINIRRTTQSQKTFTEAGTRFSRGVHPAQAILGVQRGIELMRQSGGGQIAAGLIDEYPNPPAPIAVELTPAEVERVLGMALSLEQIADLLHRLEFDVELSKDRVRAVVPDHRMDIGTGLVGQADLIEEIARVHGYDHIPTTIIADEMPSQLGNREMELEDRIRDLLVNLGLRENISYRFTTPERESQLVPNGLPSSLPQAGYVEMLNAIAADKTVLRHTLLVNLLENAAKNARYRDRQAVYEIGGVFLKGDAPLPTEPRRLGLLLMGKQLPIADWQRNDSTLMDFFDMKGLIEGILAGLAITDYSFSRAAHTTFHPGRSAALVMHGHEVGHFGEIHPRVAHAFDLGGAPVMAAEFDLDAISDAIAVLHFRTLPQTPPVYQDIALIVDAALPAGEVERIIREAGGNVLRDVRLFDVYTGDPIPAGKKSIAYSLTYQDDSQTLTDKDVAKVHSKIVKSAQARIGAVLRG